MHLTFIEVSHLTSPKAIYIYIYTLMEKFIQIEPYSNKNQNIMAQEAQKMKKMQNISKTSKA